VDGRILPPCARDRRQCRIARGDIAFIEVLHMLKIGKSLVAIAAVVAVPLSAAHAAPPPFCHDYATAAIRQVQLARSNPACDRGTGARWTSDYRVHYDWCLGAPMGAVEAERAARTNWIRRCRGM
jgi:hypothetical protein